MTIKTSPTSRSARIARTSRYLRLQIGGMSCGSCVNRVRSALHRVAGVRIIDITPGDAVLELQLDVDTTAVVGAISAAGYEVTAVRPLGNREGSAPTSDDAVTGGCCGAQPVALRPGAPGRRRA